VTVSEQEVQAVLRRPDVERQLRELAHALEQEQGHYGKHATRSGGMEEGFAFNVKVWDAYYGMPDWVQKLWSHETISQHVSDMARDQVEWLVERMQDEKDSLYMPWFTGDWQWAGRSAGHVVFRHDGIVADLENRAEEWQDYTRPSITGRRKLITNRSDPTQYRTDEQVYAQEVHDAVYRGLLTLKSRERLEKAIERYRKGFEQSYSSGDTWRQILEQQIADAQAQGQVFDFDE
jgi:hypothetical protein